MFFGPVNLWSIPKQWRDYRMSKPSCFGNYGLPSLTGSCDCIFANSCIKRTEKKMNKPECYEKYNKSLVDYRGCFRCKYSNDCITDTRLKMLKTQEQLSAIDVGRPTNSDHAKAMQQASGIDATLQERAKNYGQFKEFAIISQRLKGYMHECPSWTGMTYDKQEALEMIQHKIARVLSGDPNYVDSWHDIQGYAKLIEDQLNGKGK